MEWEEAIHESLEIVFGSICYAHIPKEVRHKLDETSEKCILWVIAQNQRGYRLFNLNKNKLIICRDVLFNEKASLDLNGKKVQGQVIVNSWKTKKLKMKMFLKLHNHLQLLHQALVPHLLGG